MVVNKNKLNLFDNISLSESSLNRVQTNNFKTISGWVQVR